MHLRIGSKSRELTLASATGTIRPRGDIRIALTPCDLKFMNLIVEARQFLQRASEPTPFLEGGAELAARLQSEAIVLSYSKESEFSPDIEMYILLAAKVALLTFGAGAVQLDQYERSVYYYNAFVPPGPIVAEYEAFKRSLV